MYWLWYALSLQNELCRTEWVHLGAGVQIVSCFARLQALWLRKPRTRVAIFLMSYAAFLYVLNTIWTATAIGTLQLYSVDYLHCLGSSQPEDCFHLGVLPHVGELISRAVFVVATVVSDVVMVRILPKTLHRTCGDSLSRFGVAITFGL